MIQCVGVVKIKQIEHDWNMDISETTHFCCFDNRCWLHLQTLFKPVSSDSALKLLIPPWASPTNTTATAQLQGLLEVQLCPETWTFRKSTTLWNLKQSVTFLYSPLAPQRFSLLFTFYSRIDDALQKNVVNDRKVIASGVFKGRRARHLPRALPFWGPPLRCYARKLSLCLVKN